MSRGNQVFGFLRVLPRADPVYPRSTNDWHPIDVHSWFVRLIAAGALNAFNSPTPLSDPCDKFGRLADPFSKGSEGGLANSRCRALKVD
jgi:hypothetical protein